MAGLAPFEPAPLLAVAVSGGSDSLALCRLAGRWAAERGGRAVGLTVDHGLRPEAAAEAAAVGERLSAWGLEHHILRRATGGKPSADIQAAARALRYELLETWCRKAGCLHLLLGHTLDDQAETVMLRLARGQRRDRPVGHGARDLPPVRPSAAAAARDRAGRPAGLARRAGGRLDRRSLQRRSGVRPGQGAPSDARPGGDRRRRPPPVLGRRDPGPQPRPSGGPRKPTPWPVSPASRRSASCGWTWAGCGLWPTTWDGVSSPGRCGRCPAPPTSLVPSGSRRPGSGCGRARKGGGRSAAAA